MQGIKYHIINICAVVLFALAASATVNQSVQHALSDDKVPDLKKNISVQKTSAKTHSKEELVTSILDSGIFGEVNTAETAEDGEQEAAQPAASVTSLTLLGTITGPSSIARALIRKNGEQEPGIFALYKVSDKIGNSVYGYKLVSIETDKVILDDSGKRAELELYRKTEVPAPGQQTGASASGQSLKSTMSRAEIKQTVMNDLDNAMKGLVAGPYRKNGKMEGYHLKKVASSNILYRFGLRSGDIVYRINGQKINSTEKLYTMWKTMQNESRLSADIERKGQMMTVDLNITE